MPELREAPHDWTEGHSSKGNQPKWRERGIWYKSDHMGYEALSEVLISELLKKTNLENFVEYRLLFLTEGGRVTAACASADFLRPGEMLVSFERLHRTFCGRSLARQLAGTEVTDQIRYTVEFVEGITGLDGVGNYLTAILELDCLFLNEDRHTNNLAVIRNEQSGVYRLCPIFDNGLALLSDLNDYPLEGDVYSEIARVQAKPFHRDFYQQMAAAQQLYQPQLRIGFTTKDVANALSAMADTYPSQILSRAETVLREQLRKYGRIFL